MTKRVYLIFVLYLLFLVCGSFAQAEDRNMIDYVSLYNRESQPCDYNEINNAAEHYQKATEFYVIAPEQIRKTDMQTWPSDLGMLPENCTN